MTKGGEDMTKYILISVVIVIAASSLAFWGGMQYQKGQVRSLSRSGNMANFRNRQVGMGNAPISGEIIAQDDAGLTLKLADGSSKIILASDQTAVNKAMAGNKADLTVGTQITVFGQTNSDGSVAAQSITIGNGLFRRPTQ
jgi:hypothetical protein